MSAAISLSWWLLFLIIPMRTLQVDITVSRPPTRETDLDDEGPGAYLHGYQSSFTCHNVLPGYCCTAPEGPPGHEYGQSAEFRNLLTGDIAAVWSKRSLLEPMDDCSGRIMETRHGPARSWLYSFNSPFPPITGASYISLPRKLPPSESDSLWMMAEGMLTMVWGGGYWASKFARNYPRIPNLRSRGIISKNKGTFYAGPPPRWVYADMITVNGTEYTNHEHGGLVYQSVDGAVLNYTEWNRGG